MFNADRNCSSLIELKHNNSKSIEFNPIISNEVEFINIFKGSS